MDKLKETIISNIDKIFDNYKELLNIDVYIIEQFNNYNKIGINLTYLSINNDSIINLI